MAAFVVSLFRLPIPDSRFPRCAFQWASKSPLGRTAPDSRLPTPYR
ncbi:MULTISPECIES: hypothetical protein [unclassified Moorena]|nr:MULTISPECIES: hypothetical protein [unclassified Moorena]NEP33431.1 hypothetical protein [Moorena sp. SIO3B2]NEQ05775.1 hypothetical protein [Moorena sp. SIO4E2]